MKRQPFLGLGMTLLLVVGTCRTVWSQPAEQTLSFPKDVAYGTISIFDPPEVKFGFPQLGKPISVRPAMGDVNVPVTAFTQLTLNPAGSTELSWLRDLPADAIHDISISNCTLDSASFETIASFTNLRRLKFSRCKLAEGTQLPGKSVAKRLQDFVFRATTEDDARAFVTWAARCPAIGYVRCSNRPFDAKDIEQFSGHPSVSFLSVRVGEDGQELFERLSKLPKLRALNVTVANNAADNYWESIPGLRQLELFNWGGGKIDEELLQAMGQLPKLRILRLQGNAILEEDFPEGLEHLTNLEELVLRASAQYCDNDDIHTALAAMPQLERWPKLTRPNKATLRVLANCKKRQRVSINGLGEDVEIEDVVAALDTDSLTSLELSDLPLNEQVARAIERNTNLEHLSLSVREFDGSVFTQLERLRHLTSVAISVDLRVANLDYLSKLPSLRGLQLFADPIRPDDLEFVARCPKLRSLDVQGGMSDDTTAKAIGSSSTLTSITLGQDCFMTDVGVDLLLENQNLAFVAMGGDITKAAVRRFHQLAQLDYLSVWSDAIPEGDRDALAKEFASVRSVDIREFFPSSGKHWIGDDGIWRMALHQDEIPFNKLEGKHARDIFGEDFYSQVESTMQDRVVLVEFWGTWCGPCLMLKPQIEDIADRHKKDGFEVISVHSSRGLKGLGDYLNKNPLRWANLLDVEGKLEKSFGVRLYPSLFLFDRSGELRVARAHKLRVDEAVERLLQEPPN